MSINHPSQFDPHLPPLYVWIGPPGEWTDEVREDVGLAIFAARDWGRDILIVANEADADFSIRNADSRGAWAGQWTPSLRRIDIDYEQAHGRLERRRSVLHEIGHMFGLEHSNVPTAVMFRRLGDGEPEITTATYAGNLATDFVTQDDLDNFNRHNPK